MNTISRSLALSVLLSVCGVPHVSGFPQSNTGRERDERADRHSSQAVARLYVATRETPVDDVARAPNLTVALIFRSIIDSMLAGSPTFRRQCARIASAPDLSIEILGEPPPGGGLPALTRIRRLPNGGLHATVYVGQVSRATELIAHEIEHIIEQLDGIDLPVRARRRASGVHRTRDQNLIAFETTRATVTGQRVAHELRANTR